MKPVNFIEVKSEKARNKNKIYLFLPLLALVVLIVLDIVNLKNQVSSKEPVISQESFDLLLDKTNNLSAKNNEVELKADFYQNLQVEKTKEGDLLESLEIFLQGTNENIFINSFSYDANTLTLTGVALSSELIDELDRVIKERVENLVLSEVNFENGYYTFSYRGELK